jgi:ABC-type sugar transport system ATPase subunit
MAAIELAGLSKHFGTVRAVDSVDLRIPEGEFLVLAGPSGCGKSTLLRMIAGLAEPSAGAIRMDGQDVTSLPPAERNVAMVFQNYALFPHMTVERNLSFGLRLRRLGLAERQQRVAQTATLLRIEELLKRYPRELSGGQKQRVALGRALIRQPRAFLFDEPLSNLDPALRVEMRSEIMRLRRQFPVTTVYVTHDQVEALTMGDRLAVMNAGRITQLGAPLALYQDPRDLFTAGFVGSPAMNLLSGHIERGAGAAQFILEDGSALPLPEAVDALPAEHGLVLGLRPEHLQLCSALDRLAWQVEVALVEEIGRERIIHLTHGSLGLRVAAASAGPAPRPGELLSVRPQAGQLLWFEQASGARLQ